jgi:hypothetical protein
MSYGQLLLDAIYRYDIVKAEYVKHINANRVSDAQLEQNLNDAWYALDKAQKDYLNNRRAGANTQ